MRTPAAGSSWIQWTPFGIILTGLAGAAIAIHLLPAVTAAPAGVVSLLIAPAPLAALIASVFAARALPGSLGRPWLLLAAAAAMALISQIQTGGETAAAQLAGSQLLFKVGAITLFAIALAWILHQRDRGRVVEIGLDGGLLLAATTLVTLHWAPAAHAVVGYEVSFPTPVRIGVVLGPIAAGCAFLLGTVLLLVRGQSRAGHTVTALFVATIAFGLAVTPLALSGQACCAAGNPAGLAWTFGWLSLTYAGVRAARVGARGFRPVGADAGGSRLRLVVAPAVALVIGAVVVDSAVREPLHGPTAAALGVLGMLLALRVSQLLYATRTQSLERVQLSQSRALIEVSHALSATRELSETLDLVTRWAVRLLNGKAAIIELLTEDGGTLQVRAAHGLPDGILKLEFSLENTFTGAVVLSGRARTATNARRDPNIHPTSSEFLGDSPLASVPLRYRDEILGALSCIGRYPFSPEDVELLGALGDQAAVAIENARLFRQVHQLSLTDPLTGLPNRRQLDRDLAREFAAAVRGRLLVAVMFDLNGFKEFNDEHGHLAGDDALRLFASVLAVETRAANMAARYGGDEFIALLTDAEEEGARTFIERVRSRFPGPDAEPRQRGLTVAAGIAFFHGGMNRPADLVAAADAALYLDKARRHGVLT
jgi:diguanylate cyclase (GGDEF)-like protein